MTPRRRPASAVPEILRTLRALQPMRLPECSSSRSSTFSSGGNVDHISRRNFFAGAAAGTAGMLLADRLWPQASGGGPRRLDLHHHYASPRYKIKLAEAKRQGWATFERRTIPPK